MLILSRTPEGHEDCEEHGGRVVKEMAGTCRATRCAQMPVVTCSIAEGTHSEVLILVTHLLAGRNAHKNTHIHAIRHGCATVQRNKLIMALI